jgi:hypothetical protein
MKYDDRNLTMQKKRNKMLAIMSEVWDSQKKLFGKEVLIDIANRLIEEGYEKGKEKL